MKDALLSEGRGILILNGGGFNDGQRTQIMSVNDRTQVFKGLRTNVLVMNLVTSECFYNERYKSRCEPVDYPLTKLSKYLNSQDFCFIVGDN